MKTKVTVDINAKKIANKVQKLNKYWLGVANEWWLLINKYAPEETGTMKRDATIEPKKITYNQEYAKYVYYGDNTNFRKDPNPFSSPRWNEAAKPEQLPKLIRYAQDKMKKEDI